jgi:hypothetical protein
MPRSRRQSISLDDHPVLAGNDAAREVYTQLRGIPLRSSDLRPDRCLPTGRGYLVLLLGLVIASGHDLVHGLVAGWRGEP